MEKSLDLKESHEELEKKVGELKREKESLEEELKELRFQLELKEGKSSKED